MIDNNKIIPRSQEGWIKELLTQFPVVAVVGARQVGKSTLVLQPTINIGRQYLTLDDFATLALAQQDPHALAASDLPLTIDEIQRVPEVIAAIKLEVDRNRRSGQFLLTGSADLNLTAELTRHLAGRVYTVSLPPITWREQSGRLDPPLWIPWLSIDDSRKIEDRVSAMSARIFDFETLFKGGFPTPLTSGPIARWRWFEAYRHHYLERDVRQITQVGHLVEYARLMELAAIRTGQLLNQASLAREVGLSTATAGRYFSLLEATFQIHRVPPWYSNIGKRLVKTPKLYWQDTGLAAFFMGTRHWAEAQASSVAGPLFETFVMMEIQHQLPVYRPSARLYFLRSHEGLEIDGVLSDGVRLLPFEIKASTTLTGQEAKNLETFLRLEKRASIGLVFYAGAHVVRLSRHVLGMPVASLLW